MGSSLTSIILVLLYNPPCHSAPDSALLISVPTPPIPCTLCLCRTRPETRSLHIWPYRARSSLPSTSHHHPFQLVSPIRSPPSRYRLLGYLASDRVCFRSRESMYWPRSLHGNQFTTIPVIANALHIQSPDYDQPRQPSVAQCSLCQTRGHSCELLQRAANRGAEESGKSSRMRSKYNYKMRADPVRCSALDQWISIVVIIPGEIDECRTCRLHVAAGSL